MNEGKKMKMFTGNTEIERKKYKELTWPFKEKKISMIRLIHSFIEHSL